jgi:ketosteroid isomerase-like protein
MSPQQNKALAHEFFALFSAGDIAGAMATMTDDATWLIPGRPDRMRTAGLYSKERIARLFHAMLKQLQDGLKMTVKSAIAEADRVAVEVESQGDLENGRPYRQQYHFLMEFRDGKICAVREYLDTQHAYDIWIAPTQ